MGITSYAWRGFLRQVTPLSRAAVIQKKMKFTFIDGLFLYHFCKMNSLPGCVQAAPTDL